MLPLTDQTCKPPIVHRESTDSACHTALAYVNPSSLFLWSSAFPGFPSGSETSEYTHDTQVHEVNKMFALFPSQHMICLLHWADTCTDGGDTTTGHPSGASTGGTRRRTSHAFLLTSDKRPVSLMNALYTVSDLVHRSYSSLTLKSIFLSSE